MERLSTTSIITLVVLLVIAFTISVQSCTTVKPQGFNYITAGKDTLTWEEYKAKELENKLQRESEFDSLLTDYFELYDSFKKAVHDIEYLKGKYAALTLINQSQSDSIVKLEIELNNKERDKREGR